MKTELGLELRGLTTGYRERRGQEQRISQGLDLSIAPGELVLFMGPNGSGKSTLMHTIAGLIPPLAGEVSIAGEALQGRSLSETARLLSLVLTERITSTTMTVRDVVRIGRYPHIGYLGRLSASDEAIVEDALGLCHLEELQARPLSALSDGERQRTMIARALAQQTPLILLDEPTAHLDLPSRLEVILMLRRLAHETGRSILISTHELELALSWADTVWLLDGSGTITTGTPEDLVLSGAFERTFGGAGLSYDRQTGEFTALQQHTQPIALVGEGLEALWTRRALSRLGYEVLDSSDLLPRVTIEKGCWWLTTSSRSPRSAGSIGELLALLASSSPSSPSRP